jgi:hypothetical protein
VHLDWDIIVSGWFDILLKIGTAHREFCHIVSSHPVTPNWKCALSGGNDPLSMFIVIAWLWRTAAKTLPTGLSSIAANLPSFAFCTGMRSRNSFRNTVRRWFGSFLGVFGERPRWRKSLDCEKKQWSAYSALGRSKWPVLTSVEHLG